MCGPARGLSVANRVGAFINVLARMRAGGSPRPPAAAAAAATVAFLPWPLLFGLPVGEGQHTGAQQINPIDIHRQMAELQSQLDSQQTRTSLAAESPGHELDAKPPAEPQQRRSHSFVSMFSGKQ